MIKLFVDSGCNLSKELKEKYDISVLETDLIFNDKSYKSGVAWEYFSPKELDDYMRSGGLPEISQSSIGDWSNQLKDKIKSSEDDILYISTSSKCSGSLRVFNILINTLNLSNKIYIIEGRFGGNSIELLALEAGRLIFDGNNINYIIDYLNEINQRLKIYDISSSMKHWAFTGRTDRVKSFTYQSGIPLIKGMDSGLFAPIGFFLRFENAINTLSEDIASNSYVPKKCVFNYAYGTNPEWIDKFKKMILKNGDCEVLADHISSPTTTAINGPDSVSAAFI